MRLPRLGLVQGSDRATSKKHQCTRQALLPPARRVHGRTLSNRSERRNGLSSSISHLVRNAIKSPWASDCPSPPTNTSSRAAGGTPLCQPNLGAPSADAQRDSKGSCDRPALRWSSGQAAPGQQVCRATQVARLVSDRWTIRATDLADHRSERRASLIPRIAGFKGGTKKRSEVLVGHLPSRRMTHCLASPFAYGITRATSTHAPPASAAGGS